MLLARLGRDDEALMALHDSLHARRQLAERDPGAYEVKYARTLATMATSLSRRRKRAEALAAIEESVGILRRRAARDPRDREAELARSLRRLGAIHRRHGTVTAEAETILELLAAAYPAVRGRDLATTRNLLALLRQASSDESA
jgi:hypothetical protein